MIQCVIFDLDGTLVDSEPLCNQAFLDLLPELHLPVNDLLKRFRGRKLSYIFSDIERLIGRDLPTGFEKIYRARVDALFQSSLKAFSGVHEALEALETKVCIASSGPPEKIQSALLKTSLNCYFEGRTFSSYTVGKWKPDPGLFLHAASKMDVKPVSCLVVEDSHVGLAAAKSAGMKSLHFCPHPSVQAHRPTFKSYSQFGQKLSDICNSMVD